MIVKLKLLAMSNPFDNLWTARYAQFLALILLYGATVHIGNMTGLTGKPWLSTSLLWRVIMDVALLIFDGVSAIADIISSSCMPSAPLNANLC